jgi:hypothetical protein
LREILGTDPKRAPALHTLTTFGRGETDHVRVFVIGKPYGGDPARLLELTWHLACVLEKPNVARKGVAFGGMQYSKGLEAAEHLWHAAYGREEAFPQRTHWYEL